MISELEDLVQGVADSFLPVLAPPAVVDSSSFLSKEVVQQSVKAPSEWGPLLAGICLESRCPCRF